LARLFSPAFLFLNHTCLSPTCVNETELPGDWKCGLGGPRNGGGRWKGLGSFRLCRRSSCQSRGAIVSDAAATSVCPVRLRGGL